MTNTKRQRFYSGVFSGLVGGIVVAVVMLYLLNMSGVIFFTITDFPQIHLFWSWVYDNLRLSLIPFSICLVFYFLSLVKLNYGLSQFAPPEKIAHDEHLLDTWTVVFFGIGVIWTAIGMRSALISALGDLDATTAAEIGAFAILQRLVDGGILLALSTTIFGGVGGYVLRILKAITVGAKLQIYYNRLVNDENAKIIELLGAIEQRLTDKQVASVKPAENELGLHASVAGEI